MKQETLNLILLLSPLAIGGIIAAMNSESVNDSTEKAEAWTRKTQNNTSQKDGWFSRYLVNPVLWMIVKFSDWTDSFTHRGLKNGTRVAATLYLIAAVIYLLIAVFVIMVALAIGAIVLYIVFKVLVNTNDDVKQGYEKAQVVYNSGSQDRRSNSRESETISETSGMKHVGTFSIRAIWKDGNPAGDVGVMIVYHGIIGNTDEKRTNSNGWVEFHNYDKSSGTIWVHSHNMGDHSLADGKTYSFTI